MAFLARPQLIQLAKQGLRRFVGCVNYDVTDQLLEEIDSLGVEGIVVGFGAGTRHGREMKEGSRGN